MPPLDASFDAIRAQIGRLADVADWPEILTLVERAGAVPRPDWELPLRACVAVGGAAADAAPAAAAIACLQVGIILVDDILDDDVKGEHLRRGLGETVNLAWAFQSAALRIVTAAPASAGRRAAQADCLARMALRTAYGQQLDVQNLRGEADYWRVVRAKSTPFYGAACEVGAIAGGAPPALSDAFHRLGSLIGELIQVEDDLHDDFQQPANADWLQGRNNLLLLYARTAPHPARERFMALLPQCADPAALDAAQDILVASGAVSYAVYLLRERYEAARSLIEEMALADPAPIAAIFDAYGALLRRLAAAGDDRPAPAALRAHFR